MNTSKLIALLVVVSGFAAGLSSWAQDTPDPVDPTVPTLQERIDQRVERMTQALDLTSDQQIMIKAILQEKEPVIESYLQQVRDLRTAIQESIDNVLTDEQKTLRSSFRHFRGPRHGFGAGIGSASAPWHEFSGCGSFGAYIGSATEPHPRMMLRCLDLTEEQQEQIRQLLEANATTLQEKILTVLTDEQKQQWENLCDRDRMGMRSRDHRGMGHGTGMMGQAQNNGSFGNGRRN